MKSQLGPARKATGANDAFPVLPPTVLVLLRFEKTGMFVRPVIGDEVHEDADGARVSLLDQFPEVILRAEARVVV